MALFDMLKNQAAQAARTAGNQGVQNLGQAARNAAANMGNKTYTVIHHTVTFVVIIVNLIYKVIDTVNRTAL